MTLIKFGDQELGKMVPNSFTKMLDNMYDELIRNGGLSRFSPSVDIVETEKQYELRVVVPGMKKEEISIDVDNENLVISGERKFEKEDKNSTFHRVESEYGSFSRSFNLPDYVLRDNIEANYNNGVLTIILPKDIQKTANRKVQIK